MVNLTQRGAASRTEHHRSFAALDRAPRPQAIFAIVSKARGSACGDCRMLACSSPLAALRHALGLSAAMWCKAALSGLPLGGGKCVDLCDAAQRTSDALLCALGKAVNRLGGAFLTADGARAPVKDRDLVWRVAPHARGNLIPPDAACPSVALGILIVIQAARFPCHERRGVEGWLGKDALVLVEPFAANRLAKPQFGHVRNSDALQVVA
jgi:leucine dehydrogenase